MLIEAIVFIGLDEVSNRALENLRKASEVLVRDYGVKLLVVPINTWLDPVNSSIKSLPLIVVNGFKVFAGYAPTANEIKECVLRIANLKSGRNELLLPAGTIDSESFTASVAVA